MSFEDDVRTSCNALLRGYSDGAQANLDILIRDRWREIAPCLVLPDETGCVERLARCPHLSLERVRSCRLQGDIDQLDDIGPAVSRLIGDVMSAIRSKEANGERVIATTDLSIYVDREAFLFQLFVYTNLLQIIEPRES